jgi:hypothetical protein
MSALDEAMLKSGWKYRAMKHTELNHTEAGALLLAVLGIRPPHGSRWNVGGCIIAPEGQVLALFYHKDHRDRPEMGIVAPTVKKFMDNFRRIADDLKFTDAERTELFELVRKWVQRDLRAVSDMPLWR